MNDLASESPTQPDRDLPDPEPVPRRGGRIGRLGPSTASKRWVYRQYDHEVGVRTAMKPGDDAAIMAIRETASTDAADLAPADQGVGLALSSGANPNWTETDPYEGARAVALENATNLAAKGAVPLAAVDCLNGGNPEKPEVYGGFKGSSTGSPTPAPTSTPRWWGGQRLAVQRQRRGADPADADPRADRHQKGYNAPPAALDADAGDSELLLIGAGGADGGALGGSEYLAQAGEQTGSRRCRTRRPRVLPTASRRSQRSPATNRRSRPTT